MKIKVFLDSAGNFDEREILLKFYRGILKLEPAVQTLDFDDGAYIDINPHYTECDVAVMMGSWKPRDRDHHQVRNSIVENARCFVVVETPLLNRKMFQKSTHHRIGVNGFLNNHGMFNHGNHGNDRTQKLGISWEGWKNKDDGKILLMLQLPGDASLRGINMYAWAANTIEKIRKTSSRKIVVRTHPSHIPKDADEFYKFSFDLLTKYKNIEFSSGKEKTIKDEFADCYCSVAYTSGSAIDSILAGIPVLVTDPGNFAFDISSNYLEEIENLKKVTAGEINAWIDNLSYSQWTPDEMESGEVWSHIKPLVSKAIKLAPSNKKKK